MANSPAEQPRNRHLQLRVSALDEELIRAAAERQGVDLTEFIMRSAWEKAEQTLADQTRFALDAAQWRKFIAALDRPAQDKPRLRRLFEEQHVAERR